MWRTSILSLTKTDKYLFQWNLKWHWVFRTNWYKVIVELRMCFQDQYKTINLLLLYPFFPLSSQNKVCGSRRLRSLHGLLSLAPSCLIPPPCVMPRYSGPPVTSPAATPSRRLKPTVSSVTSSLEVSWTVCLVTPTRFAPSLASSVHVVHFFRKSSKDYTDRQVVIRHRPFPHAVQYTAQLHVKKAEWNQIYHVSFWLFSIFCSILLMPDL